MLVLSSPSSCQFASLLISRFPFYSQSFSIEYILENVATTFLEYQNFCKVETTEQKVEVVGEDLHFPHALKQFVTESAKDGRPAGCGRRWHS